ncbi:MAG TPA: peptide chain release factor N(5)-glutamine methyltransferase [Spirochaetota bacterium]|jgi:release factor glutamine methyltransferase|nr:MAG: Release factor glutamine methyltransferase [Spirochaetes bacterium ADurb.Bin133]HNZ26089.1 peptide chain release factor N(5)-glutamine methyltransferase [Spirochaetota bacterium]HPY86750.1 peptide chain release factor N(5)-glutamine methyltransferase [Spirochaetota bacterium]
MRLNDLYLKIADLLDKPFIDAPKLESKIFICKILNISTEEFLAQRGEKEVDKKFVDRIFKIVKKRARGKSLAELVGEKEFYGMKFIVSRAVLIPRSDTELIIDIFLENCKSGDRARVLEIGSGSGVIPIVIASKTDNVVIDSIDVSYKAIKIAKKNMALNDISPDKINFYHKNILKFNPKFDYDCIVSNPPYIPTDRARRLLKSKTIDDPRIALDGGEDGCKFYRIIKKIGDRRLKNGGKIILEHGFDQKEDLLKIFSDGYKPLCYKDLAGLDRAVLFEKTSIY